MRVSEDTFADYRRRDVVRDDRNDSDSYYLAASLVAVTFRLSVPFQSDDSMRLVECLRGLLCSLRWVYEVVLAWAMPLLGVLVLSIDIRLYNLRILK
jgi:hypothetical protein